MIMPLLSTIISFFLSPTLWVLILLIIAYRFRKKKKRKSIFLFIALGIYLIFGNKWLQKEFLFHYQPAPVSVYSLPVYECAILLGGFGSPDQQSNGFFNASSDRFIQAARLFHLGKIKNLIITGGNGKSEQPDFQEGLWAKKQLMDFGIPDTVIFVEDLSNNTTDNAINAQKMIDTLSFNPPYLLITSAFHMPRAQAVFQKQGLRVNPFPSNYTALKQPFKLSDIIPELSTFVAWDKYLKEIIGYWYYQI